MPWGNKFPDMKNDPTYLEGRMSNAETSLAQKANLTDVQNMSKGSPSGTYATLTALQTALPTGDANIYVVTADGKWYFWNGTAWTAGGIYQATGLPSDYVSGVASKNLFNKNTVTTGKYINTSGTLSTLAGYNVSDYIPISPSTAYASSKSWNIAQYDANKAFISIVSDPASFTTASNAAFIRTTVIDANLTTQQIELGTVSTAYESFGNKISGDKLGTKQVNKDHLAFLVPSKNLFNKDKVTAGKYLDNSGNLVSNSNFSVSEYIPVTASTQYVISKFYNAALYDVSKTFLGMVASNPFIVPSNGAFIRVTTDNTNGTNLNAQQVELGNTASEFESYGNKISKSDITGISTVQFVKKKTTVNVGSGYEYATITSALNAIQNATEDTVYDIKVHPGTYNETFRTKDYVNIIGDHYNTCIIDYTAPDPANAVNESTIFLESDTILENLWIKTKDSKYPVHVDAATGPYQAKIRKCKLEHKGDVNNTFGTPLGIGLYQNQHLEVEDSILIGSNLTGISGIYCHNNQSSYGNGYRSLTAKNNTIKGVTYGITLNGMSDVFDQANDAILVGNRIQALTAELSYGATTDLSWNIKAHGNGIRRVYQPSNNYILEEPGFSRRVKNMGPDLVRGSIAGIWDTGKVYGSNNADSAFVVGVCMEDIPSGAIGVIQIAGWVNAVKVNGTTAIASNDFLSTHTDYGTAKKGTTNVFAMSMGAYSTADSNGFVPAILLPLMLA